MLDLSYKSIESWKIDDIDLTHRINLSIFTVYSTISLYILQLFLYIELCDILSLPGLLDAY